MITVSVIISIYKVEKYLTDCIRSVLSQTYRNVEVILVDDGSPDSCPQICDAFASQDSRIKVIHKRNGGLSDARNVGIQAATGEYIMFIDGDDFWNDEAGLEKLIGEIQRTPQCDFIQFNCAYFYPSKKRFKLWRPYAQELSQSDIDTNKAMRALIESGTFPMSACLKIIRRDFLVNHGMFFPLHVYSEDIPWFIDLMRTAYRYRFVNLYLYAYRKENTNSISSSFSSKKYEDLFSHLREGIKKLESETISPSQRQTLLSFWAYEYCILSALLLCFPKSERPEQTKQLCAYEWLMAHQLNPKVRFVSHIRKLFGKSCTQKLMHLYVTRMLW